jgi:cytochrome c oxidase cbb3-type subunit I/II
MASKASLEDEVAQAPALAPAHAEGDTYWHRRLEAVPGIFATLTFLAVVTASLFEIVPTFLIKSNVPTITSVKPYTPLELEGRDLYIREGCYNCHSQMVRPMRAEVVRYGEYSKAGEFVYDHPFQWGSKRTGPDLHRVGGKYPDMWHVRHMEDPRSIEKDSIMPAYPHMLKDDLNLGMLQSKMNAMVTLGVPYSPEEVQNGVDAAEAQAAKIGASLAEQGRPGLEKKEIVALIAYLQRLGTDIKKAPTATSQR